MMFDKNKVDFIRIVYIEWLAICVKLKGILFLIKETLKQG